MKKLWFIPLLCLIFCGCGGKGTPPEDTLRSVTEITFATEGVTGVLTLTEEGCEFSFTEPTTLKKLKVFYDGREMTARFGELETKVPKSFLGRIIPIFELLTAFQSGEARQTEENIRSVTLDEREFLLYYIPESNRITRLEVKGADGTYGYDVLSYIEKNDDTKSAGSD